MRITKNGLEEYFESVEAVLLKKKKKLWEISFLMGESCNQKPKVGGEYYLSA